VTVDRTRTDEANRTTHPVAAIVARMADAFQPWGFTVRDLPLLATERDNFDLLGYPADHPTDPAHVQPR
jgi:phenylalanyl-tRNA synthetase alpha subunit